MRYTILSRSYVETKERETKIFLELTCVVWLQDDKKSTRGLFYSVRSDVLTMIQINAYKWKET